MQYTSVVFHIYVLGGIAIAMNQIENFVVSAFSAENVKLLRAKDNFTVAPYRIESHKHTEGDSDVTISLLDFPAPFYKNDTPSYVFECQLSSVVDQPYVLLNITMQNGSSTVETNNRSLSSSSTYPFNVTLEVDMASLYCALAFLTPDNITQQSSKKHINVKYAYAPTVDPKAGPYGKQNATEGQAFSLTCPIYGEPPPSFLWKSEKWPSEGEEGQYLSFPMPVTSDTGSYVCWGNNSYGNASYEFWVTIKHRGGDSTDYFPAIAGAIAIAALSLIIVLTTVWGWNHYIPERRPAYNTMEQDDNVQTESPERTTETLLKELLAGKPESTADGNADEDGHERAKSMKYDKYVEPTDLQIDWKKEKGRGQYGKVYEGKYGALAVAVKVLPAHSWTGSYSGLMEIKVMAYVGDHPNIVKFIGADISRFLKGELYMVMELSIDGSLESYLRGSKPPALSEVPNKRGYKTLNRTLTSQTLLKFCSEIATAMEYLGNKKTIHGDLATRNVLVFPGPVAKLSDFGYARPLYEEMQYKAGQNLLLPFEWASIELILHKEFSSASDVWAFGVTVWEIFTFGRRPFSEWKSLDEEFLKKLLAGMRLPKPDCATTEVWDIMSSCWDFVAAERPSFAELKAQFQHLSGK